MVTTFVLFIYIMMALIFLFDFCLYYFSIFLLKTFFFFLILLLGIQDILLAKQKKICISIDMKYDNMLML